MLFDSEKNEACHHNQLLQLLHKHCNRLLALLIIIFSSQIITDTNRLYRFPYGANSLCNTYQLLHSNQRKNGTALPKKQQL